MLLLVVIDGQKRNLSNKFKLKPVTTYHLEFVVKILWKYCRSRSKSRSSSTFHIVNSKRKVKVANINVKVYSLCSHRINNHCFYIYIYIYIYIYKHECAKTL